MSDAVEQLIAGFADEVARLPAEVIVMLAPDEARSLGRRCARSGLASLIWASRLGDTLNTTEVSKRLKISRQALAKRMAAGTVLGIPGRTTTYYPIWQFEPDDGDVREEIREIFGIFQSALGSLDAHSVSAWMMTPCPDLHGMSPHEWLIKFGETSEVFDAARRTASRLAS